MSVASAIKKYSKKQLKEQDTLRKRKPNQRPEKELTEKPVLAYLRGRGFFVFVVESAAVYNPRAGQYLRGQAQQGTPDLIGVDSYGNHLAIELKAPQRRSTLRPAQREHLLNVIEKNGFASVTDSVKHLSNLYEQWINEPDLEKRREILINDLPRPKTQSDNSPLF